MGGEEMRLIDECICGDKGYHNKFTRLENLPFTISKSRIQFKVIAHGK